MSTLIFLNLVFIAIFFEDFIGVRGYIPTSVSVLWLNPKVAISGDFNLYRIDPIFGVENQTILVLFYALTTAAALFSALGLHTRIATILMAIGVVSINHRYAVLLHGGDTAMRVSALYLAMAPSGAAFSLDRWFAVRRGTAPAIPLEISLWPQRLIQYNLALIYFATTWSKWFGDLWKSGAATWYTARLNEFDKFHVPAFFNDFPMVKVTTWATLAVEFALGTLIWFKPLRRYVIISGVCLHLYIEFTMNIPLFAFCMMAMYVTFYEGEETVAWWERMKTRFSKKAS